MSMQHKFVSHDGRGAEVVVKKATAKIEKVKKDQNEFAAHVTFDLGTKYTEAGWLPKESKTYERVLEAYERGEEVEYRIEVQRKNKIPADIPMDKLRDDKNANDNVRSLLVSVDGIETEEMVTNPMKDPPFTTGGRVRDVSPPEQQTAIVQQPPAGAIAAVDEAPYKDYNSDGSLNLSSFRVQAAVMLADQAYEHLTRVGKDPHADGNLGMYIQKLLWMSDQVLARVSGNPNVNRRTNAYARSRHLIATLLEREGATPDEGTREWAERIIQRAVDFWYEALFAADLALEKGVSPRSDRSCYEGGLLNTFLDNLAQQQQPQIEAGAQKPEIEQQASPQAQTPQAQNTPQQAQQQAEQPQQAQQQSPESMSQNTDGAEVVLLERQVDNPQDPRATAEEVEEFKDFLEEMGVDLQKQIEAVKFALQSTLGHPTPGECSGKNLGEFIGFYLAMGEENFQQVMARAEAARTQAQNG